MINKIINRLKKIFFPSDFDKAYNSWIKSGGDEKFRYDFDLKTNSLVLDFGGYKGQWSSNIYSRYNCKIIIFEPVKEFYKNISKRFQFNKNIIVKCFALGKNKRDEKIYLNDDGSSLYLNSDNFEIIKYEELLSFFNDNKIAYVDLIKINIEGGEYELLDRLIETDIIFIIKHIQVQFHNINKKSKYQMNLLTDRLKKSHNLNFDYEFVWQDWTLKQK
jgi:FkbM family methyltransferase